MSERTIAFDPSLMRPGCAIVQRGLGATITNEELHRFEPDTWLAHPTDDMHVYAISDVQLDHLVQVVNERREQL